MNIFNSLGSNYDFATALRILFSTGGGAARSALTNYLEKRYGGRAILTYKGREALSLALAALPRGNVAINGYTCLAVYEAITESGNEVLSLDIPEHGLEFSFETLRKAVEKDTSIRVVIVQNTLGIPADIRPIAGLCRERGIVLVEDLAHSIGARYASGEEAGTVGDFVVLSFSQDKVVDAISGGALIVRNSAYANTVAFPKKRVPLSQQLKDRLYPILTWKIRAAYGLGIGKMYHATLRTLGLLSTPFGTSADEVHMLPGWYCKVILQQYKALERVAAHRKHIADVYARLLNKELFTAETKRFISSSSNLRFPITAKNRNGLIAQLRRTNVHVSDIWYDAPIAPKKYLHRTTYKGQCPHAENVSGRMVNLPTHINVSTAQAETIAGVVNEWHTGGESEYSVRNVAEERTWEEFLHAHKPHSFLHSWTWGEQHKEIGSNIFRIGVYKAETLVAIALLIKVQARRGSFLLCPHGPVFPEAENIQRLLELIIDESVRIGKEEDCAFIRFCPLSKNAPENATLYRSLGFRDAPIHMHPELAWMLDITKPEDDLLREMRKTTRYLVKKMEKEGVEITQSNDPKDIEKFWPVYEATVQRQQFTPFSKENLRKEFELFAKERQAVFFFGTYKGEIIAAAIIIFYNGSAYYHHSGSIQRSKDINASYLLQWRVIQEAKRRGCTLYNFWGISPADRPKHPWAGLSLFKKGFGGFSEEYLHAQDKPLTPKYILNYAVETMRRIRRGL